jgi:hypothetical protein
MWQSFSRRRLLHLGLLGGSAALARSIVAETSLPEWLSGPLRKQVGDAIARGQRWLLTQQGSDGGWHSLTYGGLRDGAAVTSLAIATLAELPEHGNEEIVAAVDRAATFLQKGFSKRRTIASPDGSLDYPTYATALVLKAMPRFPKLEEALPGKRLVRYLVDAQAAKGRGFTNESPDYGGWDLLGVEDATGITTGTNISVTAQVLDVLPVAKTEEAKAACELARAWVHRAQDVTSDGGFAFTPEAQSLNNKAQWRDRERRQVRSYGTATADGLRALVALASPQERIEKAVQWLVDRPAVEVVPGFEDLQAELGWRDGLRYYYAQSLSQVLRAFPLAIAQQRAEKLARWLVREQSEKGYWRNESARMREDDPLLATSFALTALGQLLRE